MTAELNQKLEKAYNYVRKLFKNLPAGLFFHNWLHTKNVFAICTDIGREVRLSPSDFHSLQLAALFHDLGYLYQYTGHEDRSILIANIYMNSNNYSINIIEKVAGCISATKTPQKPCTFLEEIICDADLSHFSTDQYFNLANDLKNEWLVMLKKEYSDRKWNLENLALLKSHSYFTNYGQTILQPLKEENIKKLKILVQNPGL